MYKLQYGDWTKYHAEQNLGPINTWTIPSTTTDVVSYSSEDTISLNGKGGHYETCYKSFTVKRSGQYTISYDYNLPTVNFYGTNADHMYFGIFITTNEPPGGDMPTYSAYSTGNCNGYVICGPSSQNNSPGVGSASFTYNLTAGVTYYLWVPMMNLADGVQTYLTFTNLKWTETAESSLFVPIGLVKYDSWNGYVAYESTKSFDVLDFYPIGSYFTTKNADFDPNVEWGGEWELDTNGKVTRGGTSVGQTGGEITHATTTNELPGHTHTTTRFIERNDKGTNWGNDNITSVWDRRYGSSGITVYKGNRTTTSCSNTSNSHNNVQKSLICKRWHRVG